MPAQHLDNPWSFKTWERKGTKEGMLGLLEEEEEDVDEEEVAELRASNSKPDMINYIMKRRQRRVDIGKDVKALKVTSKTKPGGVERRDRARATKTPRWPRNAPAVLIREHFRALKKQARADKAFDRSTLDGSKHYTILPGMPSNIQMLVRKLLRYREIARILRAQPHRKSPTKDFELKHEKLAKRLLFAVKERVGSGFGGLAKAAQILEDVFGVESKIEREY
jgi:hypothetical protein